MGSLRSHQVGCLSYLQGKDYKPTAASCLPIHRVIQNTTKEFIILRLGHNPHYGSMADGLSRWALLLGWPSLVMKVGLVSFVVNVGPVLTLIPTRPSL